MQISVGKTICVKVLFTLYRKKLLAFPLVVFKLFLCWDIKIFRQAFWRIFKRFKQLIWDRYPFTIFARTAIQG